MAKILVFTSPAKGHLYPITPALAELVQRGHQVTVVTLPGSERSLRPLGITVRPLPAELAEDTLDDWNARSRVEALRAAVRALVERIPVEAEALRAAVEAERPDALLIDATTPGAQLYAAAGARPWASWSPMLLPTPSRGVPPYGPGLRPMSGLAGRIRDGALRWVMDRYFDEMLPRMNGARAEYGLEPLAHMRDYFTQAPLLLNFTAPPFDDVRRDWPASIHQVGPGLWAPPGHAPQWLESIDRPIALVTCSTEFQDDGQLAQIAMDALADSGFHTVVTAGAVDPAAFSIPANARVESFLPHHLILDRTAVVVSHGGMGITQKALAAGVPVCVVPFGRDQSEVARRVVTNAAGTWVPKKKLSPERLRAGVEEAMTCGEGAARVAAGFAAAGGTARAADLLERQLTGSWSRRRDASGVRPRPNRAAAPLIRREDEPMAERPSTERNEQAPGSIRRGR